jgi:2-polyprenyl-3-methyl-5-hydroxy-6-metoxy-1,4-benzoquinol methylase
MKEYIPEKYWEELLSKDFSLSGVGYQGLGKNYNKWLYRARKRIMGWFLRKYPLNIKDINILDIGCGTGFYVEFWEKKGAIQLTGMDLTRKSVTELSKKYDLYKFFRGNIGDNELKLNEKFDLITAFDVLFHIVDEERFDNAIRNIGNMARPEAIILISDNFLRKPRPSGFNQAHRTLEQYERAFLKNRIEILDLKPIFYLMNGPIDIRNDFFFKLYSRLWCTVMSYMVRYEVIGEMLGSVLYIIDGMLIKVFKNSITTELLVCRKL